MALNDIPKEHQPLIAERPSWVERSPNGAKKGEVIKIIETLMLIKETSKALKISASELKTQCGTSWKQLMREEAKNRGFLMRMGKEGDSYWLWLNKSIAK